uniref:Uncharacterized protein n=1 Tax=Meloidogyne hapla TaxID=6305 RepID=A0A1I8C1E0_MELHA
MNSENHQNIILPLELYFEIFKTINTYPIELKKQCELLLKEVKSTMPFKSWKDYAIKLFTSSKIIYINIKEAFHARKIKDELKKELTDQMSLFGQQLKKELTDQMSLFGQQLKKEIKDELKKRIDRSNEFIWTTTEKGDQR